MPGGFYSCRLHQARLITASFRVGVLLRKYRSSIRMDAYVGRLGWTTPPRTQHTYASHRGVDSRLERRNGSAGPGTRRFRYRWVGRERHRGTDVRLCGGQAGRHVFIHAEEFVLGIPQAGDLVLREFKELGDQPSPINYGHQVHELYTVDRATWRLVPGRIHGLRHGHGRELECCVHHIHDQGVDSDTGSEPIAKPEADRTRLAPTFGVTLAFAFTNFVALTWHGRRHAIAQRTARCATARRHRWRWAQCLPTRRKHRRNPGLAVDRPARLTGPGRRSVAVQELAHGCVRKRRGPGQVGSRSRV